MRRLLIPLAACALLAACGGEAQDTDDMAVDAEPGEATLAELVGNDSRFAQALEQAGMSDLLSSELPYTILAPTDAAFDALGEEQAQRLMSEEGREDLVALLSAHILPGTIMAQDARTAAANGDATLPTYGGSDVTLSNDGDALVLRSGEGEPVRIVEADLRAERGVVHRIDGLLLP